MKMPDGMGIGSPVLKIKDIDKVLAFYERVGMHVNRKRQNERGSILYELGFKYAVHHADRLRLRPPLVILHYDPNAKSQSRHSAGLFHFAILVPERVLLPHI